jgi:hypothetical protein
MKHIATAIIIIIFSCASATVHAQEANGTYTLKDTVLNNNPGNDIATSYSIVRKFNKNLKSFRLSIQQYDFVKKYKDDIDVFLNDLAIYKSSNKYIQGREKRYYIELLELEKELSIDRDKAFLYKNNIKTIRR